jgi:hypothetical protein
MIWSNYFTNPLSITVKKFLFELLKDKYVENEKFIDRISNQLTLEDDAQAFVKIVSDSYRQGYLMCLEQHKEALSKVGMSIKVIMPENKSNSIFNQSEKSG